MVGILDSRTRDRVEVRLNTRRRDLRGTVFVAALQFALLLALLVLTVLLVDAVRDGWGILGSRLGSFLSGTLRSGSADPTLGVHQGLVGTFWLAVFVATLAFPVGIGAAVYLVEYAPDNRFTRFVELNIRNLAGVPSVVYGLLGLFLFVKGLDGFTGGRTLASAGLTLAILVMPIVVITASEAIRAVPAGYSEAALGLGATRWDAIRTQVLPAAAPGILTGTLLSMSRAVGEAAPLILVGAVTGRLGRNPGLLDTDQITSKFTAMPIVITQWVKNSGRDRGFSTAAAAAIVVLLVFVLALNSVAIVLRNRFESRSR